MAHQLHISVEDSVHNLHYLYVKDYSKYDPMLPAEDCVLQVLVPGYYEWRTVIFPKGGNIALTSGMLGLGGSHTFDPLPDGLYQFRYSVNPHDKVFTTVKHYRTSIVEAELTRIAIDLYVDASPVLDECGNLVFDKNKKILSDTINRLKGLKLNVQFGSASVSDKMYREVELQLSRIRTQSTSM